MRRNAIISKCLCLLCLLVVCGSVTSGAENQDMIEQLQTILNDETLSREQIADSIQQLGVDGRNAFIYLVETGEYECMPHVAVYAAQDLGISELAPAILSKLGELPNDYPSESIMETLRVLNNSEVTPELIKIIRNEAWSKYSKWRTAYTLLVLGSPGERAEAAEYFKEHWDNWDSPEFGISGALDAADFVRELGPPEYAQEAIAFLYQVWDDTESYHNGFYPLHEGFVPIMWRLEDPDIQANLLERMMGNMDTQLSRAVEEVITRNDERFIPLLHNTLTGNNSWDESHLWDICYRILMENYDPGVAAEKEWLLNTLEDYTVRYLKGDPNVQLKYIVAQYNKIIEYFDGPGNASSED